MGILFNATKHRIHAHVASTHTAQHTYMYIHLEQLFLQALLHGKQYS